MLPPEIIIPIIAILTIFVGVPAIIFYGILRIKRENRGADAGPALGVRELEDRIRKAVEAGNEPMRRQLAALEQRLDQLDPAHQLEARTHEERPHEKRTREESTHLERRLSRPEPFPPEQQRD